MLGRDLVHRIVVVIHTRRLVLRGGTPARARERKHVGQLEKTGNGQHDHEHDGRTDEPGSKRGNTLSRSTVDRRGVRSLSLARRGDERRVRAREVHDGRICVIRGQVNVRTVEHVPLSDFIVVGELQSDLVLHREARGSPVDGVIETDVARSGTIDLANENWVAHVFLGGVRELDIADIVGDLDVEVGKKTKVGVVSVAREPSARTLAGLRVGKAASGRNLQSADQQVPLLAG